MSIFADTFFWIALTDPADAAHRRATEVEGDIVTTDEVLTEYLNYFSGQEPFVRRKVSMAVERILRATTVEVIPQSRESFLAGVKLYQSRLDKGYSLTDCISMQTMRREGLVEVLTNDRHFEQEGFQPLFRG